MNDGDSPEEIERDIERTRAEISRTLNDLQHRLSPSSLIGETLGSAAMASALRSARSGTADFATSLGRAMSQNPLPVLLTGIGIAWLLFSRSGANGERRRPVACYDRDRAPPPIPREDLNAAVEREDPSRDPVYEKAEDEILGSGPGGSASGTDVGNTAGPRAGGREPFDTRTDAEVTEELKAAAARKHVGGVGQRAGERTRGAAAAVSGRVGRVSQTFSRGVDRMTGAIKGSGGAAYRTTKDVAERATSVARQVPARVGGIVESTGSFIQDNPVISGAIAVVLGAALALIIPPSRRERQLMGDASDEVRSSVREAVKEKVEPAKDVVATAAEVAADAARKEASGEGGEPAGTGAAGEPVGEPVR